MSESTRTVLAWLWIGLLVGCHLVIYWWRWRARRRGEVATGRDLERLGREVHDDAGTVVFTGSAHETWTWLRDTGRLPPKKKAR